MCVKLRRIRGLGIVGARGGCIREGICVPFLHLVSMAERDEGSREYLSGLYCISDYSLTSEQSSCSILSFIFNF